MPKHDRGYVVGIVGATGAVGVEIIKCLKEREFPMSEIHLYSSAKSSVSGEFSLVNARLLAAGDGPVVIDNSSAWRYDADVPLVVPEINFDTVQGSKLIANPNCTSAIAAVVLHPLIQEFGIKRLIMSTYQAASGAGAEGMDELIKGTTGKLNGEELKAKVFAYPLPFNLIPHIDSFQENGYTKEEMKVVWETLKIFALDPAKVKISCTAVRVPILRAHSEAITLETLRPISVDRAKQLLATTPGVRLVDDPLQHHYPMPLTATHSYEVEVGRVRESLVFQPNGLDLFVVGDQLLRGAALNAVLIAEAIVNSTV